jgi:predicted secreted hydrolase
VLASSAWADASSGSSTVPANGGVPALVDPAGDLAAQPAGSADPTWVDSIFIAGFVRGGGHEFGILVHTVNFPNSDLRKLYVGITDVTTRWFKQTEIEMVPSDQYSWSSARLDIAAPGLTWTGGASQMHLTGTTPWGALDATFVPQGPVLNYTGNGQLQLLGDVNSEYAFPTMRTTGTLTVEGKERVIKGVSWLDRQWGPVPVTDNTMRWTWMNLALSNGDQVAVWDILNSAAENSWATVMHPDGSYEVVTVKPLAEGARRLWSSPTTGKTYPTRWRVVMPSIHSSLVVSVIGPRDQEYPDGHVEATASVGGTENGSNVTGRTFIEMTGDWH